MSFRVLLVDDDEAVRTAIAQTLDLADMDVEQAADADAAMKAFRREPPGVVISDVRMAGEDGFALMARLLEADADLPVVLLTGHGDVPMAVRAISEGAYDFLEKPASPARLLEVARRAMEKRRLVMENRRLRDRVSKLDRSAERLILGDAPASVAYRERMAAVAAADADVLIEGEPGVGKEGAARGVHSLSERRRHPFVIVNCGASPPDIAAAELFGSEAGAIPGAHRGRPGRFEEAEGGVVFLDRIEALAPENQVRLLRVLEQRETQRLGGRAPIRVDVRVLAATTADLRVEAAEGRFREDLFYRLDVVRLRVPPLRERIEDAPLLFASFVARAASDARIEPPSLTPEAVARLCSHHWPGNVRELRSAAERYALGLGFEEEPSAGPAAARTLATQVDAFEKSVIAEALRATGGRVSATAEILGVPRKTLYDKLNRHGLVSADFRVRG